MDNFSEKELLNYALSSGMIDFNTIQKQFKMNERRKYLEMHESKIWQSTDGKWYTYMPDATKEKGKRLLKRKTKKELEDAIVGYYKNFTEPQTIEKTYREWIAKKVKFMEISQQTIDRYNTDFNKYFSDCKSKDIRCVDEEFLDDFITGNIKTHNMKTKAWSNLRTIIRGMFRFAKKNGYTQISISDYLEELELSWKMFNHEKKPKNKVIYSQKEIDMIVCYISQSKRLNDIAILFAVYTGMRVGEILALKWEDIFADHIHVNRTQIRYHDENGNLIHDIRDFPKSEAGIRDIVIVPELAIVIKRLRMINPFTEYLFEKNGSCIHLHSVCTRLYNLCNKFGFERKGMHAIRKYYATKLINAGVEKIIIISQMGHTDFSTTEKHYYEDNEEREYVVDRITKAISG